MGAELVRPIIVFPTLGALLVILTFILPLPAGEHSFRTEERAAPSGPDQCLTLVYSGELPATPWPSTARLSGVVDSENPDWYLMESIPRGQPYSDGHWRPGGGDSIEIAWYDSQSLLLTVSGGQLLGRSEPWGGTLVTMLTSPSITVRATRRACP